MKAAVSRRLRARASAVTLSLLRRLLQSRDGVPFENVVRSIPERMWDPEVSRHVRQAILLRPAIVETPAFARPVPAWVRTSCEFADQWAFELGDVEIDLSTGACRTRRFAFLETYGSFRQWILETPFRQSRRNAVTFEAPVTFLRASGYFHFALEQLPRILHVLAVWPDTTVLIGESLRPFQAQFLDLITRRYQRIQVCVVKEPRVASVNSVRFTRAEPKSGFVPSNDLEILRSLVYPEQRRHSPPRRLLYISRKAGTRRFDNEAELEAALEGAGFEILTCEDIPLLEQIALFGAAAVVVAPHGAGLTNLVWCPSGTRVLELFSPRYMNDCYAWLAASCGLEWDFITASKGRSWGSVDVKHVMAAIDQLCATGESPPGR